MIPNQYKEAKKTVQAQKHKGMYMVIHFDAGGWNTDLRLVLPYDQGVAFIAPLQHAEQLQKINGEPVRITHLERDKIKITTLSREDYETYKMAALLGVSIDDLRAFEEQPSNPPP
jgi:hypothetical protein